MTEPTPITPQRVRDLVVSNRAIRSPGYDADPELVKRQRQAGLKGVQWGADLIPALMGLFLVEKDPRDERPHGWVGFARHWRGETLRLELDVKPGPDGSDPVLVLTAVSGREEAQTFVDGDVGEIVVPDEVPTQDEWEERSRSYEAARRSDDSDGAAAVKAYIDALPDWKGSVARRIDEIIRREVPGVRSDVKWHIPFYGLEGRGWFASVAAFSRYVKVTFLRGASLDPEPPREHPDDARALDIERSDTLDEKQLASWVRQAAAIPGWGGS